MHIFQKIRYRINCHLHKLCYKLMYGKALLIGNKVRFRSHFFVNINKGGKIIIGDGCFFNNYCSLNSHASIKIGNNCLFGENVKMYDHNHCYKNSSHLIKDQGFTVAPIMIGNNCWISSNCTILKGVTIGNNCIIGAGCVIYKNIPDNSVVVNKQTLSII